MGTILLSMLGMALPLPLRGKHPTAFTGEQVSHNVKIYRNPSSQPVGSLILLMGYGGHLSWTLTQWWYLHPAWAPSDQEWCKPPKGSCVFGDQDKVTAQQLTNNLRIVDAVGQIIVTDSYYGGLEKSHAWYRYAHWPDGPPIEHELEEAVSIVFNLIEQEYKIVGSYDRIAIAGMSQGADLALEVGIRFPHRLGMVFSERGVLKTSRTQSNQTLAAGIGTRFILTAGDSDELSPLSTYKRSCASLQRTNTPVYFKAFPGLDHGSFSKPEWELMMKTFSLMLGGIEQIDHLTTWDSCAA
jgi:predicted esterase